MQKKTWYVLSGVALALGIAVALCLLPKKESSGDSSSPARQIALLRQELSQLEQDLSIAKTDQDRMAIRAQRTAMETEIEALRGGLPAEYQREDHPYHQLAQWAERYHAWGYSSEYGGEKLYHILLENPVQGEKPLACDTLTQTIPNASDRCADDQIRPVIWDRKGYAQELSDSAYAFYPYGALQGKSYGSRNHGVQMTIHFTVQAAERLVFRYDPDSDRWIHLVSANKVGYLLATEADLFIDSEAFLVPNGTLESKSLTTEWYLGDFYQAERLAAHSAENQHQTYRQTQAGVVFDGAIEPIPPVTIPTAKLN